MSKERKVLKLAREALLHAYHEDEAHPKTLQVVAAIDKVLDPCIDGSCDCCWKHLDEPEPVAWLSEGGNFSFEPWQGSTPLYTTPQNNPQRTWVGLTEEERHSAYFDKDGMALDCYDEYAWAIEAKLKEKNT